MSSFKKIASIGFVLLTLSSCGFRPMYGDSGAGQAVTQGNKSLVEIANIPDRDGQQLRNLLIDRLYLKGRPADAPYILTIAPLKTETTHLGIRKDATSTRAMTQIYSTMVLRDRATNRVLLTRDIRSVGSYNELDNQFATLVSSQSLAGHMLEELSDDVVTEINLYFSRQGTAVPEAVTPAAAPMSQLPPAPIAPKQIGMP